MLRPVPEFMAAVMPTTRSSRSHSRTSASPKTWVYCGGAGLVMRLAGSRAGAGLGRGGVEVSGRRPQVGRERHAVALQPAPRGGPQATGRADRLDRPAPGHRPGAEDRHDLRVGLGAQVAHALLDPDGIADRG